MSGKLYIVSTPIGNLDDISQRALDVLGKVDLILAEDTRRTRILLDKYKIVKPVISYHQHSPVSKKEEVLLKLASGESLALVSDSGTPGISDPGNELIDYLLDKDAHINVISIPGPSAVTAALSVSGFNVNKFVFIGYFPRKKYVKVLDWVKEGRVPLVFFESPRRIIRTIERLIEYYGRSKRVFIGRELTKMHETCYRGTLGEGRHMLIDEKHLKGEVVVVVES